MQSRIWQLVYVSRSNHLFSAPEMLELEKSSKDRNTADGLTGLLLFDGAEFIQAIEGPEQVLRTTLARIINDPRHNQMVVAADEPILSRQFGNWAMKCRNVASAPTVQSEWSELAQELGAVKDSNVRALFIGFIKRGQVRATVRAEAKASTMQMQAFDAHQRLAVEQAQARLAQTQAFRALSSTQIRW